MSARAAPRLRRFAAVLGMFALLFGIAVPVAHERLGLGALAPWLGVPLCHAGASGAEPSPGQSPAAPGKCSLCPFCFGLAGGVDLVPPPALPGIAIALVPPSPLPHPHAIVIAARDRGAPAQPRAPPAFA